MTDRTYTEADINAAIAAALDVLKFYANPDHWEPPYAEPYTSPFSIMDSDMGERARALVYDLRPDAARILRERDARVYAEALEAAAQRVSRYLKQQHLPLADREPGGHMGMADAIRALTNPYGKGEK